MEINVLEESPKRLVFELKGEDQTILNPIKVSLWENKHVRIATYSTGHPLVGVPKMTVETDGEVKPRKAVLEAVVRLQKETEKLRKELSKIK